MLQQEGYLSTLKEKPGRFVRADVMNTLSGLAYVKPATQSIRLIEFCQQFIVVSLVFFPSKGPEGTSLFRSGKNDFFTLYLVKTTDVLTDNPGTRM